VSITTFFACTADVAHRKAAVFTNLGIAFSAVQHLARLHRAGRTRAIQYYATLVRSWAMLSACLGFVVTLFIAPLASALLWDDWRNVLSIAAVAPIVACSALSGGEMAILKGLGRVKSIALLSLLTALATLLITTAAYLLWDVSGILPALCLSALGQLLLTLRLSHRVVPYRIQLRSWNFLKRGWKIVQLGLAYAIAGFIIGLLIGVYRTAPASKNKLLASLQKIFGWFLNVYIEIFRGTPMIVQSMVIYYGTAQAFGISIDRTIAAIFIVSINTGAYMSEIVRGGIFAVDKGQFEAATALGMTHGQTMRKIVLPQVVRNILPATGNEFVINIKDTSVLNVISVVELYFSGNTIATQTYQYFQTFTIIAAIYFVLTFSVTRILRYVEKRFDTDNYTTGANQMQTGEVKS